jgi:hypothetical protein
MVLDQHGAQCNYNIIMKMCIFNCTKQFVWLNVKYLYHDKFGYKYGKLSYNTPAHANFTGNRD